MYGPSVKSGTRLVFIPHKENRRRAKGMDLTSKLIGLGHDDLEWLEQLVSDFELKRHPHQFQLHPIRPTHLSSSESFAGRLKEVAEFLRQERLPVRRLG